MKSSVRKKVIVTVRIVNADAQKLRKISEQRNITIADLVREAIRRYISETEKYKNDRGIANSSDSGV